MMANEMVERVARAISFQDEAGWNSLPQDSRERLYGGKWNETGATREDFKDVARAAIKAMRRPTEAMVGVGDEVGERSTYMYNSTAIFDLCASVEVWSAMIDEALKDPA